MNSLSKQRDNNLMAVRLEIVKRKILISDSSDFRRFSFRFPKFRNHFHHISDIYVVHIKGIMNSIQTNKLLKSTKY